MIMQKILWTIKEGQAEVVRCYGTGSQVEVPSQICESTVTALAPYCFSEKTKADRAQCEVYEESAAGGSSERPGPAENGFREGISQGRSGAEYGIYELCGSLVERVQLPDSLEKIGNCTFYNCRELMEISFGSRLASVGSDAFMNTRKLKRLILRCRPEEKTGLRQILVQIPFDIEVVFQVENEVSAVLFFPEYYETYDEIAPAHIFGRNITGEGFRARQAFRDGVIDVAAYDDVFARACAEESEKTLCHMAWKRLAYPYELEASARTGYEGYLQEHLGCLMDVIIREKNIRELKILCGYEGKDGAKLLQGDAWDRACVLAAEADWVEGSSCLLEQAAGMRKKRKKERYEL